MVTKISYSKTLGSLSVSQQQYLENEENNRCPLQGTNTVRYCCHQSRKALISTEKLMEIVHSDSRQLEHTPQLSDGVADRVRAGY